MNNHPLYANNDLRKKIQDYSYGLKDVIGRGFSSVVYRGSNDRLKQRVAIKVIDIKSIQGKPQKKMLEGEIEALKKLNHPNVLKCHDIFSTANNCYIISEFCNEGDLQNLLKKRQKLSEEQATPLIREILMGFIHIAENGFLHRDLKPANILLQDKTIKIADFGFAKKATSNPKQTVNVGSPLYMSPEALQSNIYTIKNDIWSIGVIMYQIIHGKVPWKCSTQQQLKQQIRKNNVSLLKGLSQQLKDFIRKCLIPDEKNRLCLKDLIKHPLMTKFSQITPPMLLRKVTSFNENQDINLDSQQNIDNNDQKKPKYLLHRQSKSSYTPDKQFICQLNWMRFLNKFSLMFPSIQSSGRYTFGLRFIVVKQLLSQLQALQISLQGQNPFQIQGWNEFIKSSEEKQNYKRSLAEYRKVFAQYYTQLKEWVPIVGKDKKMFSLADENMERSQFLSMIGVSFAIEESRNIRAFLQKEQGNQTEGELSGVLLNQALRLDFTMTYYQLNCFLLDNFNDSEYFTRISKLQTILEIKPSNLQYSHLPLIQNKFKSLQLVK